MASNSDVEILSAAFTAAAVQANSGSWKAKQSQNWATRTPARGVAQGLEKTRASPSGNQWRSWNTKPSNAPVPKKNVSSPPERPTAVVSGSPLALFLEKHEYETFDEDFFQYLVSVASDLNLNQKVMFWNETRSENPPTARDDWLNSLQVSRTFTCLQKVIQYISQIDAGSLDSSKVFLFKQGIKPVWEDRANYNGGRFVISCTSLVAAMNTFTVLALRLLTGRTLPDSEFTGLVLKLQAGRYAVEVWNRNSAEKEKIKIARKEMKKLFRKNVMYHVHRTSIKMVKYGPEAVLPEIQKAEAAKAEKAKQKLEVVVVDKPVVREATTVLEEVHKALVTAALASAWTESAQDASE